MTSETVGFIGLGIMGSPMAKNLVDAGYDVVGHNRSDEPVADLEESAARVRKRQKRSPNARTS